MPLRTSSDRRPRRVGPLRVQPSWSSDGCGLQVGEECFEARLAPAPVEQLPQGFLPPSALILFPAAGSCAEGYLCAAAARCSISSGVRSSLCVAMYHLKPNGSTTPPVRSP